MLLAPNFLSFEPSKISAKLHVIDHGMSKEATTTVAKVVKVRKPYKKQSAIKAPSGPTNISGGNISIASDSTIVDVNDPFAEVGVIVAAMSKGATTAVAKVLKFTNPQE